MEEVRKYPGKLVFGLDIGTRSIVGTVGYKTGDQFYVVAQRMREHETRAMLDGQIHDIGRVGMTIMRVKTELEAAVGGKLTDVCIAAAGRVLKTITVHTETAFEEEKEITAEDISFRKYVWKLDHSGAITSEERKSMVGIYRLLDKVEKSDGAVIGQVIKDGRELSFSSLLSAVRTRKAKGIDQTVDDEFGALEEVETKSESISDQIGAAFGDHMVQRLKRELSPSVLKHKKDTYLTEPLEVILEECSTAEAAVAEEARYYEERAAEIREMAAEADSEIMQYLKDMEMPDSIVNIHLMKFILEQNGRELLKRYTKQESEQIINSFDDPEELQEVYETIDEAHEARLEEEKQQPEIHYDEVKELARMASSVSFYRQMRQFQRYEVPIVTEQGVTSCSVTLKKGTSTEKGTVEITVDSFHFGSVQATFKVTGNRVSQFVTSDDEQALGMTKEIMISFEKDLEMNGFTMERGNYAKGRRNSFHLGDRLDEAATNDRLYLVAKLFIQNVQRKEEE